MIVVDSGSTGSRAHLYKYEFSFKNTPILIKELQSKNIKPGLASLPGSENQGQVNKYLSELFAGLEQEQEIPVYYYSTAGMRLLSVDQQKIIYNSIAKWFKAQKHFKLNELRTISGHEEGVFAWLGVNYLAGTFSENSSTAIGVMDFGGASVQIAAAIDENIDVYLEQVTELMVSGKSYRVFSQSFLGLGINELTKQFLNEPNCFATGYPLPNGANSAGNVITCEHNIELLTNNLHHVSDVQLKNLTLNVEHWLALGSLSHLHSSKPFESLTSQITMKQILSLAESGACTIDWLQLKKSDPYNQYLYSSCLASAYFYAITVAGYGLNETTIIDTKLKNLSKDLDWTYGVVIKNHNSIKQLIANHGIIAQ